MAHDPAPTSLETPGSPVCAWTPNKSLKTDTNISAECKLRKDRGIRCRTR